MSRKHKQTEQLYLAFHSWRAQIEGELDNLDTDYLQCICTDMHRALSRIEHELAARDAAVPPNANDVAPEIQIPHERDDVRVPSRGSTGEPDATTQVVVDTPRGPLVDAHEIGAGQWVRVTTLQATRGWHGRTLVTVPAGVQVEGMVQGLTADGFFELRSDSGELRSFSANDRSIAVERVAATGRAGG